MYQSQVTFKMPRQLKEKALKKARSQGVTLKALYTFFTEDYIQGKISFNLNYQNEPEPEVEVLDVTPEMQKDMKKIANLLKKKRNK